MDRSQTKAAHRILSLDGGGTWALIQVHALMAIFGERATGHDVLRQFELVAANSGGSIVAASLALDMPLKRTARLFEDETSRRKVFRAKIRGMPRWVPLPRYSARDKLAGLESLLGPESRMRLSEWAASQSSADRGKLADLLIIGFDYDTERATFFRTRADSKAASSGTAVLPETTLLDAVHASTNAPVAYFDEPTSLRGQELRRYWDGAVAGYNNPALAGIVEGMANGATPDTIRVLSIGTGTVRRPRRPAGTDANDELYEGGKKPGYLADFRKLATAILGDPPDAASFIAHVMLGHGLPGPNAVSDGPLVRMCPVIRPQMTAGRWDWSPPDEFELKDWQRLFDLDMDAVEANDVALIKKLALAWLDGRVPNQPIRSGADLRAEIGHDTFPAARRHAAETLNLQPANVHASERSERLGFAASRPDQLRSPGPERS